MKNRVHVACVAEVRKSKKTIIMDWLKTKLRQIDRGLIALKLSARSFFYTVQSEIAEIQKGKRQANLR